MKKPKWQRARIIRTHPDWPQLLYRTVWAYDNPQIMAARNFDDYLYKPEQRFRVNLEYNGFPMSVPAISVELLARDEHAFAEDVPLVKWQDWLKESAPEKTP